jgi:hypothetical protein
MVIYFLDGCYFFSLASFSQGWLETPQEVLQADWQEVWHSPQPPVISLCRRSRVSMVLILFIFFHLPDVYFQKLTYHNAVILSMFIPFPAGPE